MGRSGHFPHYTNFLQIKNAKLPASSLPLSLNPPEKVTPSNCYFTFSKSSKNLSRDMPAVVIFVRICVTGTSLGLVFITKGLFIPAFVIMI